MTARTKNVRVISGILSLILMVMLSCDSFKDDFILTEKKVTFNENVFYIQPGSSIVIDLNATVKESFIGGSLSISMDPVRGTISRLDTQFLKYKPAARFTSGEDQFVISVSNNGNFLTSDTVTIIMVQDEDDLPCPFYAVEDKVHVKPASPISIFFLENDRLCGTGDAQVSIQINPQFGEARLIGDSVIVYTPGAAFTGLDQLVYKLSSSSDEAASYGSIRISNSKIQNVNIPASSQSIFFVDENIGFLGGNGIYKTTDGGEHWNLLSDPPFDPKEYCLFNDLFFLDANNGFASYYSCGNDPFTGGLIVTADGGTSWKKIFDHPVESVFFTSTATGFIGASTVVTDESSTCKIFKTEDGGSTWRETFTSPDISGKSYWWEQLGIQFINSSTGYALLNEFTIGINGSAPAHMNKVFVTLDAGETWTLSTSKDYIFSIALAPENITSAVFGPIYVFGQPYYSTPSSIVRSKDATTWHTVASFPYGILHHKFSSSGDLGIAVGMSDPRPSSIDTLKQVVTINMSVDKGVTWIEEETDEPFYGFPWAISIPSNNVAYILCGIDNKPKIIKYTR